MALALPAGAGAAEAGVNISGPGPAQAAQVRALGVHWVRMFVSWRSLEPARGVLDAAALNDYEQGMRQLPAGTQVVLDVVGAPAWETGTSDPLAPPANPADYAAFVATLAHRFAPWVGAYEIWNEEDEPRWWTGAPDPGAYVRLLQATYPAVKAADPSASVVLGGLTGNDYQFMEGVYAAGGRGWFDAVGVHTDTACNIASPYEFLRLGEGRIMPDSFVGYREVHQVMLANGDDKPIWMTELSWRTTDAVCPEGFWAGKKAEGVSEAQQATYLEQAYHCLAEVPYVQVALWFPVQDGGPVLSGLYRADGSRKPSFAAMRAYARSGDRLSEPCGSFTGPAITVGSPTSRVHYSGPLPIHVWAKSPQGVFRIRLQVDGRQIRNYDGSGYPSVLSGAITWQGAKHISFGWHTLTFTAYDKERNVSQTSVLIFHAKSASSAVQPGRRRAAKAKHHRVARAKHHRRRRH